MKMTAFQLVFTGVFVAFIVIGVLVFSVFGGVLGGSGTGTVVIWGTADHNMMETVLQQLRQQDKSFQDVHYVEKNPATYHDDLVNAMAGGVGPDLFFVQQDDILAFSDKIWQIPYSAVSQSQFTSSYIDEGRLFLTPSGSLALPILIDPLVMYYNRDLLASAGIAQPPQYWNDFISIAPKLTVLDSNSNLTQSAVALGMWSNIVYAKQILTALIMQAGDPIVSRSNDGNLISVFGTTPDGAAQNPAASALQFYTEFANPSKTTYSWNRSLPRSLDAFAAGDLAIYFGFASDYATLAPRNPNLHFGVALLPQIKGNSTRLTYGNLTGVAISHTAANPNGALLIAEGLTSKTAVSALAQAFPLPPVRSDVSADTSASAAAATFVQSALIAHGWLDPNVKATDSLFKVMVESTVSGESGTDQAVQNLAQELSVLLRSFSQQP